MAQPMPEPCPDGVGSRVRASLQEPLPDGRVRCLACPRYCAIPPGLRGACGTKVNVDGVLCEVNYSKVSSVAMDPIEKKPLFHFYPGSWVYSIGTVGCNLFCDHCQNWQISQPGVRPEDFPWLRTLTPEDAVRQASELGAVSIAYTYNEPTIVSLEWVLETARLARRAGLKNVSVTNGYWSREARELLAPLMDAANIDVKAFSDEFYRRVTKVTSLRPILETVEHLKREGVHVELTYLIIPGLNDSEEEIRSFARWVVERVGEDTPLHFSRFHPDFRMLDRPATPLKTLEMAHRVARDEGLKFVYLGNVPGDPREHTYCPRCGARVIERYGFDVHGCRLTEDGRCASCGEPIPIVGECRRSSGSFYLGI